MAVNVSSNQRIALLATLALSTLITALYEGCNQPTAASLPTKSVEV